MSSFLSEGLLHPLVTPAHLILLLGIALLTGQQARLKLGISLFIGVFIIGLLSNRLFEFDFPNNITIEQILLSISLIIGLLTVLKLNLPCLVIMGAVVTGAFVAGYDSTPIVMPGISWQKIVSWQIGATLASVAVIILPGILAYQLRHLLQGVPLRVMASWISTAALLVLTLSFAG
jgi:hydrogenase/urease accessory protein HupE